MYSALLESNFYYYLTIQRHILENNFDHDDTRYKLYSCPEYAITIFFEV